MLDDYEHPFTELLSNARLALQMFDDEINDCMRTHDRQRMDNCHRSLDELQFYARLALESFEAVCADIEHAE